MDDIIETTIQQERVIGSRKYKAKKSLFITVLALLLLIISPLSYKALTTYVNVNEAKIVTINTKVQRVNGETKVEYIREFKDEKDQFFVSRTKIDIKDDTTLFIYAKDKSKLAELGGYEAIYTSTSCPYISFKGKTSLITHIKIVLTTRALKTENLSIISIK